MGKYDDPARRQKLVEMMERRDEPWFVFRAQDQFAAPVMRAVATELERLGAPLGYIASAGACAIAMEEWAREHETKVPD